MRTPVDCFAVLAISVGAVAGVAALAALSSAQAAQPLEVRSEVTSKDVIIGDVVELDIRVTSRVDGPIEIELPSWDGFTELSRGQSESASMSFRQGRQTVERQQRLFLELSADAVGARVVGPIKVRAGRAIASTRPISVKVRNETAPPPTKPSSPDAFSPPDANERGIFLRYRVDKGEAYVGEQILLDLEIFADARSPFSVEALPPPPTLDGFWREVLDQPRQLEPRVVTLANKRYEVYRAWRIALFALEAGPRTIPSTSAAFSQGRTVFQRGERVRRRAPALALTIRDLPAGRPADFKSPNVGSFSLESSIDADETAFGRAVTLHVTLRGEGNIRGARLPELGSLRGFRVFPPTISDAAKLELSGVRGEKRAEYLLVPTEPGTFAVPSLELAVFDPARGEFYRARTQPLPIRVLDSPGAGQSRPEGDLQRERGEPSKEEGGHARAPGDGKPRGASMGDGLRVAEGRDGRGSPEPEGRETTSAMGWGVGAVDERGSDEAGQADSLRPMRLAVQIAPRAGPAHRNPAFIALFLAPPLLFLGLLAAERLRSRLLQARPGLARRASLKETRDRFGHAMKAAADGEAQAVAELHQALVAYLSEKVGLSIGGLTIDEVTATLAKRGAPDELIAAVRSGLEHGEWAKFAPGLLGRDPSERDSIRARHEALRTALDAWNPRLPA